MGQCKFCGEKAGFLRSAHKECKKTNELGKNNIISLVASKGSISSDLKALELKIEKEASESFINKAEMESLLVKGYEQAVDNAFDDGVLSEDEENALNDLLEHFSLSQTQVDNAGKYTKVVKGAILRDIFDGEIPERIKIEGNLPFNLQKTEKIVWVFQDVKYYEQKTRTQYVGGSQGVSLRIAKGVYYRTGAFKGERVQTSETIHADTGLLGVTNKHIYFAGENKRFRINYAKIVAFDPFSDGIGVMRDAATAKPQSFVTQDGWFTYNLITNLAQM